MDDVSKGAQSAPDLEIGAEGGTSRPRMLAAYRALRDRRATESEADIVIDRIAESRGPGSLRDAIRKHG